jgi:VanZ family protein
MYCGPALSYAVVIFILSSLTGNEIPHLPFWNVDKVIHFLEFGLFGIFLYRAFCLYRPLKRPYLLSLAAGIPYAALDEVHQYFVPGRNCSIADLIFDVLGIALMAALSAHQHKKNGGRNGKGSEMTGNEE